jgi:hypothetical protein
VLLPHSSSPARGLSLLQLGELRAACPLKRHHGPKHLHSTLGVSTARPQSGGVENVWKRSVLLGGGKANAPRRWQLRSTRAAPFVGPGTSPLEFVALRPCPIPARPLLQRHCIFRVSRWMRRPTRHRGDLLGQPWAMATGLHRPCERLDGARGRTFAEAATQPLQHQGNAQRPLCKSSTPPAPPPGSRVWVSVGELPLSGQQLPPTPTQAGLSLW